MIIAAHIESSATVASYLAQHIIHLAAVHPEHQFIIFSDRTAIHGLRLPANCRHSTIKPIIRNSLLLHYWYNYKLPKLLTKSNANLFISESNTCSLRTVLPQVMLVNQLPVQPDSFPSKHPYRFYYKKFFKRFAEKAQVVCVTEPFIETELVKHYPVLEAKTATVLHGLPITYNVPSVEDREMVLSRYTDGHEYFIYECSIHTQQNQLTVLKAFSIFKKRLKSGMRLIVLNRLADMPVKDFKNYKYRNEVLFISNVTAIEEQAFVEAAYAALYLPSFTVAQNFAIHCMQSGVPLVCSNNLGYESIYETASMYVPAEAGEVAAAMMTLYKDEDMRRVFIDRGLALSQRYNWNDSSDKLWQTISNYIPL